MLKVISKPKFTCTRPFSWLEVNEDGQCHMCCPSWLNKPIGNINTQSIDEIWNSHPAQEIRQSMHDGSFKFCNDNCPFKKTHQGPVRTLESISEEYPKYSFAFEEHLTELPYPPVVINMAYDPSCNLSCPSCRTELIVVKGSRRDKISQIHNKLLPYLKQATYLNITGSGDAFGSPLFRGFLRNINLNEFSNLKTIDLQTNGNLWTKEMWNSMSNIHSLDITAEISIDAGTKETYEINRRGGDWDQLMKNLDWISTLGYLIQISFVVQKNNYREMPKFIDLGKKYGWDVLFSKLVDWRTFTPNELKNRQVHLPDHPEHQQFLDVIRDPIFNDKKVRLGNIKSLR